MVAFEELLMAFYDKVLQKPFLKWTFSTQTIDPGAQLKKACCDKAPQTLFSKLQFFRSKNAILVLIWKRIFAIQCLKTPIQNGFFYAKKRFWGSLEEGFFSAKYPNSILTSVWVLFIVMRLALRAGLSGGSPSINKNRHISHIPLPRRVELFVRLQSSLSLRSLSVSLHLIWHYESRTSCFSWIVWLFCSSR